MHCIRSIHDSCSIPRNPNFKSKNNAKMKKKSETAVKGPKTTMMKDHKTSTLTQEDDNALRKQATTLKESDVSPGKTSNTEQNCSNPLHELANIEEER